MTEAHISAAIIGAVTVIYTIANKEGDIISLIGIVAMFTVLKGC